MAFNAKTCHKGIFNLSYPAFDSEVQKDKFLK